MSHHRMARIPHPEDMELVEVPSSRSLRDRVGASQEKKAKFYGARRLSSRIYLLICSRDGMGQWVLNTADMYGYVLFGVCSGYKQLISD